MKNTGKKITKRGEIYRQLEEALLSGQFPLNERLPSERDLAERYGVTRTTIRRALIKLRDSGMMICTPRCGYDLAPVKRGGLPVRGHLIGLLWKCIPSLERLGGFLSSIEHELAENGHSLLVAMTDYDAEQENDAIRRFRGAGVEGLIIAPATGGGESTELERWIQQGNPVVLHGHRGRWLLKDEHAKKCHQVDVDNLGGVRILMEFIRKRGHRSAGFISIEALRGSERYEAFSSSLLSLGIRTRPEWQMENIADTREGSEDVIDRLRASGEFPSVLVCSHAHEASALMGVMREQGIKIPDDLSIAAFGDPLLSGGVPLVPLTIVTHNGATQSKEIIRLLMAQLENVQMPVKHVRVPCDLIDMGSVGKVSTKRKMVMA